LPIPRGRSHRALSLGHKGPFMGTMSSWQPLWKVLMQPLLHIVSRMRQCPIFPEMKVLKSFHGETAVCDPSAFRGISPNSWYHSVTNEEWSNSCHWCHAAPYSQFASISVFFSTLYLVVLQPKNGIYISWQNHCTWRTASLLQKMGVQILTAASMKIVFFWFVAPCS
jgi:hypothetical protein